MFTKEQKEKLKELGSGGLTIKMAQHDGYIVDESDSQERSLMGVFGQKYFSKKASLRIISKGISAMNKLAGSPSDRFFDQNIDNKRFQQAEEAYYDNGLEEVTPENKAKAKKFLDDKYKRFISKEDKDYTKEEQKRYDTFGSEPDMADMRSSKDRFRDAVAGGATGAALSALTTFPLRLIGNKSRKAANILTGAGGALSAYALGAERSNRYKGLNPEKAAKKIQDNKPSSYNPSIT